MNITTSITLNMQTPGYVVAYEPQGNKLSRFITATLKNGSASWSVPSGATAMIRVAKPDGTFAVYDKNENGQKAYTISGSTVTIELVGAALAAAGDALVTVIFLDSTGSNLSPFSFRLIIMPSAVSDDDIVSSDYFNIFQETIDSIQQMLTETQAMYGSPLTAATASAMKNTSKIYVYVGAESGYSYGHWYYYNGSAWVDGGIYNSEGINSNWIYEAFFMGTIENTSTAHFTDGADNVPVKALRVAINPVQSGTGDPSPTNVRPISGWTEANVNVAGKNLLQINTNTITKSGITLTVNSDGTMIIDGTATGYVFFNLNYKANTKMIPSGEFILSGNVTAVAIRIYADGNRILNHQNTDEVAFTIPTDINSSYMRIDINSGSNFDHVEFKPMIRLASDTDQTFEPYKGTTYPISFGSAGTVYGGTLTINPDRTGQLVVDRAMGTVGSVSRYEKFSNDNIFYFVFSDKKIGLKNVISDRYFTGSSTQRPVGSITGSDSTRGVYFHPVTEYESASDFKAGEADTVIVYELATPITYQLTPVEVLTLLGENNIWADTGDIEELVYRADASLYLDNKINATKSIIAGIETNMVATKSYVVGDLLIVGDVLYKVASPIASGATFTPGTNVNATTVAEQLILLANS